MRIAVTGHQHEAIRCSDFELIYRFNKVFKKCDASLVTVGMACGTDLLAGIAALESGILVEAVIPWAGHQKSKYIQKCPTCVVHYQRVLDNADMVEILNNSKEYPGPAVFHVRNRYMVDGANMVATYWSGNPRSGTGSTVNYANKTGKPVENVYGHG